MKKIGSLSLFFFRRIVMFLTKKFWPFKFVFIITTQAIVLLLGFANCFGVYSINIILNLRNRQVPFKKPTFEKNAVLSDQETLELSPFLGWFKVPLFYNRSLLNVRHHPSNEVEEWFCNRSFFVKNIFKEKEKVSAFLANSTSVIQRNECQKTFTASQRNDCITIHAFDKTNTSIG